MRHRIGPSTSATQQLTRAQFSVSSFRIIVFFLLTMDSVEVGAFFQPPPTESPSASNQEGSGLWGDDDATAATNSFLETEIPLQQPTETPATPSPTVRPVVPPTPLPTNSPTKNPTPEPTKNPTPEPTIAPTRNPTPGPTPFPTFPPTKNPTPGPTPFPTPFPTSFPTRNPTPGPTPFPTPFPTPSPTIEPTATPTKGPTPRPTPMPSQSPTGRPTQLPSSLPSKLPTPRPTKDPTQTPSRSPTGRPSVIPTREDSSVPTVSPSISPTGIPSIPPTLYPSQRPTKRPTSMPSRIPTNVPSISPTVSLVPSSSPSTPFPSSHPSRSPTMQPSLRPSSLPSSMPSQSPSLPLQEVLIVAFMTLAPYTSASQLSGTRSIAFERATREHVFAHIKRLNIEPDLLDLSVQTDIKTQVLPEASVATDQSNDASIRMLQDSPRFANNSLIVEFNVFVTFRSVSTDHDLDEFVFSGWDAPDEKESFIERLKSLSSFFQNIKEVNVEVEGFIPRRAVPVQPADDALDIAVIAGGAGGGALLILLCGYLYVRSKTDKELTHDAYNQNKPSAQSGQRIAAEILVEPQDEVSTLGDPMFAPGGMLIGSLEKDEVTASVGDHYDYARQYRNERNPASLAGSRSRLMSEEYTKSSSVNSDAMMSKLGRMGESLFADDASFEQQFAQPEERFDIVAPAGKLGMVIDTPNGGFPMVHAIKDTSVLSDRVRVGDRLLSVDGDDCTAMTAMQVSKLISLKSEKPARVLIFARSNASPTA